MRVGVGPQGFVIRISIIFYNTINMVKSRNLSWRNIIYHLKTEGNVITTLHALIPRSPVETYSKCNHAWIDQSFGHFRAFSQYSAISGVFTGFRHRLWTIFSKKPRSQLTKWRHTLPVTHAPTRAFKNCEISRAKPLSWLGPLHNLTFISAKTIHSKFQSK